MSHRSDMDASIRRIEQTAADELWRSRDDLSVDLVLSDHQVGPWEKRFVRYGTYVYHPVVSISSDLSSATAMVQTPEGPIVLQAGHGPLSDAWDAALSWRILKLLKGRDPVLQDWVVVPRPESPTGKSGLWSRILRRVSPTITLTDPYDIVRHDLAMHVITSILENGLRAQMPYFTYDLGHGVKLQVYGKKVPRYTIIHPEDGSISIPRRLRAMYDEVISLHEKSMMMKTGDLGLAAA